MSEEEINQLTEKIKTAVLSSEEDFLKMKKRLGQKIVTQIDGKIVTRTPDYFLRKMKEKKAGGQSQ
jgi:hypothetical protein